MCPKNRARLYSPGAVSKVNCWLSSSNCDCGMEVKPPAAESSPCWSASNGSGVWIELQLLDLGLAEIEVVIGHEVEGVRGLVELLQAIWPGADHRLGSRNWAGSVTVDQMCFGMIAKPNAPAISDRKLGRTVLSLITTVAASVALTLSM